MQIIRAEALQPGLINPLARIQHGDTLYIDIDDNSPVSIGDYVLAIDEEEKPFIACLLQTEPEIVFSTAGQPCGQLEVYGILLRIVHNLE